MHKLKSIGCALMCAAVLAGCQSSLPVYQSARIPPLPPELAEKHEPNLMARLLMLLLPSPEKATPPSDRQTP